MSGLASSFKARLESTLISSSQSNIPSSAVIRRADALREAIGGAAGSRILSMDPSPATLLALLVVAEQYSHQVILGRPSVDVSAIDTMLQPDVVVHSIEEIEKCEGGSSTRNMDPGVLLLTSGTTGPPKVVHQTIPALLGRVRAGSLEKNRGARWLLTYETHSFAGLQVILSAALSGGLLVVPDSPNPRELAFTAAQMGVTHISGTPTFWRALLIAVGKVGLPALRQVTIGGEAVDQATIDRLISSFPDARISHIYASTEAGALFAVQDGRAGFPHDWLGREMPDGVHLRIRNGILEVRSPRRMLAYASGEGTPLTRDGWLNTGDLVRIDGDRVLFCGRRDHVINIAGLKVSPEEVETYLLAQPAVAEAQVYAVPSPLTGALLAARVILQPGFEPQSTIDDLRATCAESLPAHKLPRRFEIVEAIRMSSSGKKVPTP